MPEYKRGEIYYVRSDYSEVGHEVWSGRPAIVVSNNDLNQTRSCVEVVYLTTRQKTDSPCHVTIHATGKQSIALCEQISTVDKTRLSFNPPAPCVCTKKEMAQIDAALLASLALDAPPVPTTIDLDKTRLLAERDIYKTMYENLLNRLSGTGA